MKNKMKSPREALESVRNSLAGLLEDLPVEDQQEFWGELIADCEGALDAIKNENPELE